MQKRCDFEFGLKGRGFSRAVSIAKSTQALAAEGHRDLRCDFFRSLLERSARRCHRGISGQPVATFKSVFAVIPPFWNQQKKQLG